MNNAIKLPVFLLVLGGCLYSSCNPLALLLSEKNPALNKCAIAGLVLTSLWGGKEAVEYLTASTQLDENRDESPQDPMIQFNKNDPDVVLKRLRLLCSFLLGPIVYPFALYGQARTFFKNSQKSYLNREPFSPISFFAKSGLFLTGAGLSFCMYTRLAVLLYHGLLKRR